MSKAKVETLWEDVSPETAAQYLLLNKCNRPLKRGAIAEWADEMRKGEWKETHQGIAFDTDGNLIDGQNRLSAVVEAKVTVRMLVTYNLDPSAFLVIDDGVARSGADLFVVRYQRKYGEMPVCVQEVPSVAYAMLVGMGSHSAHKEDVSEYALKHYKLILEFRSVYNMRVSGTTVAAAFARAAMYFGREAIAPLVLRFSTEMWSSVNDPLKILHAKLLRAKLRQEKRDTLSKQEKYAVTVAAIRNALMGSTTTKLVMATKDFGDGENDKKLKARLA